MRQRNACVLEEQLALRGAYKASAPGPMGQGTPSSKPLLSAFQGFPCRRRDCCIAKVSS